MSGIAGIIRFDGAPVEAGLVEKMTSAIAHRGPDGINHWIRGSIALGQCMLRTTPESLEEAQPLANEDESLVMVMDGRVDNWEELRRELLMHDAVLRNRSDAELVLRAYETWGRDCLDRIEGDFALAIWDSRRREAFCARDRMGHKPFNYHWDGKIFAFASELRAILDLPWVGQAPNEGMLAECLSGEWLSRDETLWRGILRLVAAHRMTVGCQGPHPTLYWEPDLWAPRPFQKDEDYIEHYRELLFDEIRRLSRSHSPVAIEVSGGLDSSAVFCVAENLRRTGKLLAPTIEGYTLAFKEEDGDAYELNYARAAAEHIGHRIHETPPSRMPLKWFADRARADMEFPGFPNIVTTVGMHEQAASQGSRVLLTGEGGDPWLGGSRVYYADEILQSHWRTLLECFKADASSFGIIQASWWLIRQGLFPILPHALRDTLRSFVHVIRENSFSDREQCYWLSRRMRERIAARRQRILPSWERRIRGIAQQGLLEFLYDAFPARVLEDQERLIAHAGMEIRHPLYGAKFVQYAFSTPGRLRLRGDTTKLIHVRALRDFMPKAILERKTKAEFCGVFHEHLKQMEEIFCGTLPREWSAWFDIAGMAKLFRHYRDNPKAYWAMWLLWCIYGSCEALRLSRNSSEIMKFSQDLSSA